MKCESSINLWPDVKFKLSTWANLKSFGKRVLVNASVHQEGLRRIIFIKEINVEKKHKEQVPLIPWFLIFWVQNAKC